MQQQLLSLQENVQKLQRDLTDVDILTQHVHDTLYTQQQRDAARQTVAKGWPKDFSDEARDAVIKWCMEKANVDNYYTTTHGRYMHGRCKRSQITIIHWKEDWAKQTLKTTSTSGTTNATQSESRTRTIKQYTTAASHTESALSHRPVTWKGRST